MVRVGCRIFIVVGLLMMAGCSLPFTGDDRGRKGVAAPQSSVVTIESVGATEALLRSGSVAADGGPDPDGVSVSAESGLIRDLNPEPEFTTEDLGPARLSVATPPLEWLPRKRPPSSEAPAATVHAEAVDGLCQEIGNTLGSVTVPDCVAQTLRFGSGWSVLGRPLVLRDFRAEFRREPRARVMVLGGIHGDEYSSVSIMFRWMEMLPGSAGRDYHWRFLPLVNPDGLLEPEGQAERQNANGVDLNRNFPTDEWTRLALDHWEQNTGRNPRRYPGSGPASEPEVSWVVEQIESFQPDVIVSVHAPYHLLDFDGPSTAPEKIGELQLHRLGVYPGSLGNYGGLELNIPVVTMELPSAGIMPTEADILRMWQDLAHWLDTEAVPYLEKSVSDNTP